MQLTRYTDYALRVMMHVASQQEGRLSSIAEIAAMHNISKNNLMKVVQHLGQGGFLHTVRGRNGGLRLGRLPEQITLGQIVRYTEKNFDLVECGGCILIGTCTLPRILCEAAQAFLEVLDKRTLADVLVKPEASLLFNAHA